MAKNLMNKSAFAALAGVSNAAITKLTKHGKLKEAMAGKKIDANHPACEEYLNSSSRIRAALDTSKKIATGQIKNPSGAQALKIKKKMAEPDLEEKLLRSLPEDIRKLSHLPLMELVDIFGTDIRFLDWLKAIKEVEVIAEKRIKNATSLKELVSRELIKRGVIAPFDAAHQRLLTDGCRTLATRLHTKFNTGTTVQEAEAYIRSEISKILKPIATVVKRTLDQFEDEK